MAFNNDSRPDQTSVDRINEAANNLIRNIPTFTHAQKILAYNVTSCEPYGLKSVKGKIDNSCIEKVVLPKLEDERLKVSSFEASSLRICSMKTNEMGQNVGETLIEKRGYKKGDIIAKFMFGKRKMEWEIKLNGVKIKIGTQWDHISNMSVRLQENSPGILQFLSIIPPMFSKDANTIPRQYEDVSEFNLDYFRDQNTLYGHILEFPPGVLDKHIQKLVRCNTQFSLSLEKNTLVMQNGNSTRNCAPRPTPCHWDPRHSGVQMSHGQPSNYYHSRVPQDAVSTLQSRSIQMGAQYDQQLEGHDNSNVGDYRNNVWS